MKRWLCILLALLLLGGAACAEGLTFADELPSECYRQSKNRGTVERISYPSRDYLGDGGEITKHAVVYLPFGIRRKTATMYWCCATASAVQRMNGAFSSPTTWATTFWIIWRKAGRSRPSSR